MSKPSLSSQLEVADALVRAHQNREAANLLIPLLKENPQVEEGWLLLSYAIQDPKKKRECLQKVLVLNPNHARAKERLAKLELIISPELAPGTKPKGLDASGTSPQSFRKRRHLLLIIISFGLIAALVYMGSQVRFLDIFKQPRPIIDLQSTRFSTHTPFSPPLRTSTPSPSATVSPTSSPSPTDSATPILPTPTYNFGAPTGNLAQAMDDIQNQVSTIRGLPILIDNPRYLLTPTEAQNLLNTFFQERYTPDQVQDELRVLLALGLVEAAYDLHQEILFNLGDGLGGFYIPWKDEIFVSEEKIGAVEKFVYAYEYNHVLVDQHYHLEGVNAYPECIETTDRCMAFTALVEGDATFLMYQWLLTYGTEDDIMVIHDSNFSPIDQIISGMESPPPYLVRETYFKYFDGQNFVAHLYEQGGWAMVDTAYANPPLSSEQVLHPEKYKNNEKPFLIELVPLDEILGEDWRHLKTDSLGELFTQMILGYNTNHLVQIDPIAASEAAAGWGGDQYQVYYHGKSNQTILVAQWQWDSQSDSDEFWEAMGNYLSRRYAGHLATGTDETCYTFLNDHISCIFRTSNKTLWIMAPNLEIVDVLSNLYPDFRN